jgi:glutamate-1-semialdehyde 2,1-aminomutase
MRRDIYEQLETKGKYLESGFKKSLAAHGIKGTINRVGSMSTLFFGMNHVRNADQARQVDRNQFARFFHGMLARGVYLPPSPFETMFISLAHGRNELRRVIEAFDGWARDETAS